MRVHCHHTNKFLGFMMSNLPALVDVGLIQSSVKDKVKQVERAKELYNEGSELLIEELGEVENEIRQLSFRIVDLGRGTMEPNDIGLESELTEEIEKLFKDFCKQFHPDVNPEMEMFFRDTKHLYDTGDYNAFIEHCGLEETSSYLSTKYFSLVSKLASIESSDEFKIAHSRTHDRHEYHRLMVEKWDELKSRLKNYQNIVNTKE